MAKCPKCGADVATPIKTWSLSRKTRRPGVESRLMGLFECPECKARFRSAVEEVVKVAKPVEVDVVTIKSVAEKIKSIKGEFMQTLESLREKIKALEAERANLLLEIEELRKMAESKAAALESEVSMLKEEVKSLRELLGCEETEVKTK